MRVVELRRATLNQAVLRHIVVTDRVIDIGPGIQPQSFFRPQVHLCVEAHPPYVERLRTESANNPERVFLQGTWQSVLPLIADKSIDSAFALDLIEHLTKEDGFALLRELERVSRRQIVIFTPLGFYPQSYEEQDHDRWGMDGMYWQTHRSGWTPEDFATVSDEWTVYVCPDFHTRDQYNTLLAEPAGALWAVLDIDRARAGEKTAWAIGRGKRRRLWVHFQATRVRRFVRAPRQSLTRAIRRLAGKPRKT